MNKIKFLLLLGLIFYLNSCASTKFGLAPMPEKNAPVLTSRTIKMDQTLSSSFDLNAAEYNFSCPISLLLFDNPQNEVLIVGTNKKNDLKERPVFLFRLGTGEIPWTIKSLAPNFTVNLSHHLPNRIIFEGRNNETFGIDRKNGSLVWQRPGDFTALDLSRNLAYSRQYVEGKTRLEAFDPQSGKTLWTRNDLHCGWWGYNARLLENETLLFYGDGLHLFDMETGLGWDYAVDTDAVGGIGKKVALEVLSALSGTVNTTRLDRYENLSSNALILEDRIYYAGNRILVCVDLKTGEELWNVEIPKIAAHSGLFDEGDHILMIGFGWCHKNNIITDYSIPFIARFNKESGKQLLYQELDLKSRINDYVITPDGYFLISAGKIIFVHKNNLSDIIDPNRSEKDNDDTYSSVLSFIKNPQDYYILDERESEESYISLSALKTDDSDLWVRTSDGIVHFNRHLEVQNRFPDNLLHFKFHELDSAYLIRCIKQKCDDGKNNCKRYENIKVIDTARNGELLGEIRTEYAGNINNDSLVLWDKTIFTDTLIVLPWEDLNSLLSKEANLAKVE